MFLDKLGISFQTADARHVVVEEKAARRFSSILLGWFQSLLRF